MKHHTNPYCAACHLAHDSINGRYCDKIRRYVEHDNEPPCNA